MVSINKRLLATSTRAIKRGSYARRWGRPARPQASRHFAADSKRFLLASNNERTLVGGRPVRSATAVVGSRSQGEFSSAANDNAPLIAVSGVPLSSKYFL